MASTISRYAGFGWNATHRGVGCRPGQAAPRAWQDELERKIAYSGGGMASGRRPVEGGPDGYQTGRVGNRRGAAPWLPAHRRLVPSGRSGPAPRTTAGLPPMLDFLHIDDSGLWCTSAFVRADGRVAVPRLTQEAAHRGGDGRDVRSDPRSDRHEVGEATRLGAGSFKRSRMIWHFIPPRVFSGLQRRLPLQAGRPLRLLLAASVNSRKEKTPGTFSPWSKSFPSSWSPSRQARRSRSPSSGRWRSWAAGRPTSRPTSTRGADTTSRRSAKPLPARSSSFLARWRIGAGDARGPFLASQYARFVVIQMEFQ